MVKPGDNEIFSDQIVTVMPSKLNELAADDLKDENNIVLLTQEDKASQILSEDPSFLQDENKVNIRTIDYNEEKLILGIRNMKGGIPKIENFTFSESDHSWKKEWHFFAELIKKNTTSDNGYQANLIVDAIYKSSKKNITIDV